MRTCLALLFALFVLDGPSAWALAFRAVEPFAIDGAEDLIIVPEPWNGAFIVYAHGYTPDRGTIVPYPADLTPQNIGTKLRGGDQVLQIPLNLGYAVGTTTYRSVGWAVADAVKDIENVRQRFIKDFGRPTFTYIWGHSEGGMVTQTVIEKMPGTYDGALPLCGVGAGARRNFNGAFDLRAVYEYVCRDVPEARFTCRVCSGGTARCLDGSDCPAQESCGAPEAAPPPEDGLTAACTAFLLGNPSRIGDFVGRPVAACFGTGSPTPEQMARRDLVLRSTQLPESFLGTDLFFASVGMGEVVHRRTGGQHPWSNVGVDYAPPLLTRAEQTALNAGVPRTAAAAQAARYMREFYEPRGRTRSKVLTLHALDDGLVLPQNEEKYREVFLAAGRADQLNQLFTATGGHCGFSGAEHLAAFLALTGWVEHGTLPTASSVEAVCNAVAPLAGGGPCRIADADPGEFGQRVVERREAGVHTSSLVCNHDQGDCPPGHACVLARHHCR